jgi:hypothetical protein
MQLVKTISLYFLCLSIPQGLFAQITPTKPKEYKHELGLNVTNLLTDLLGNNNRTDAGVYLLSYKFVKGNKAIRIGATTNFAFKKEKSITNSTIDLNNQNFQLRVGQETRHNLSPRLQYYVGFDGIAGYRFEESAATINFNTLIQSDKILLLGLGPVLGFQFTIYDRLQIGTEGSLYAAYSAGSTKFSENFFRGGGGQILPPNKESNVFNLQTNLPKFLFLILKF